MAYFHMYERFNVINIIYNNQHYYSKISRRNNEYFSQELF